MRCQAHFAVRVGIAHFKEGHSVPAVRLGTEGMYLSAFMLRRSCLPGFLCQRPSTESGKGNTLCFWLLHGQYLEGSYNADTQLHFQLIPHGFVYTEKFISVCILYGTGTLAADITAVVPQDSVQGIRFAVDGFQNTACDKRGFILGVEVTAGNVHDSVAWDKIYDNVTSKFDVQFVAMDAGYKTPWIAKKTLDDGKVPVLPYTRYKGSKEGYRPWDYKYDPVRDVFTCPHGQELRHTTTDRDGKRIYRSTPKNCVSCPSKAHCKANEKGQKLFTTHI